MIKIDGKEYELKYNLKRIRLIEEDTGKSAIEMLVGRNKSGLMMVSDMAAFFKYGVKEAGADAFLPPKQGEDLFEQYLIEAGWGDVSLAIQNQLQHDVPFMFPGD